MVTPSIVALAATDVTEPLRVIVPVEVIVPPVRLSPLVEPEVAIEVTVPVFDVKPDGLVAA
jgi:hypothetical protein